LAYVEQQDITLSMIIEAGLLQPGTIIYAASDINITGLLNKDGSINLMIDGKERVFPYPSGAARAIRKVSVSGWVFWKVKEAGKLVELLKFKQKYIESFI